MTSNAAVAICLSVCLSAGAQIALKAGMTSEGVQRALGHGPLVGQVLAVLLNPWVIVGLALYVTSAAVWLVVLARVPVSTAYPFVAVAIVLTGLLGRLIFHDNFPPMKIAGSALIVGGVALLARA